MADGKMTGAGQSGSKTQSRKKGKRLKSTAPKRFRPVRRGQLISPFGVGAITDFRNDEALMCAGLDAWFGGQKPPLNLSIAEERLQQKLGKAYFVRPPEFSEADGGSKIKVPYVRFPLWHYCPRCFRMKKATLFGPQPTCDGPNCVRKNYHPRMIPSRIIAICEEGHIEDFPYKAWIGCQCADGDDQLYFKPGRSSASLAGIKIECGACGRRRSLAGSFDPANLLAAGAQCSGAQPWLGKAAGDRVCACGLQTVQRGASNVYFPQVASSIYIPPKDVVVDETIRSTLDLDRFWRSLSDNLIDGHIDRTRVQVIAEIQGVDVDALYGAAEAKLHRMALPVVSGLSDEDFRFQEYEVLKAGIMDPLGELFCEPIKGEEYGWLSSYVRQVGLVRKLRETRALVGFSRNIPRGLHGDGVQPMAANSGIEWLPAIEVRGEGIYIEFDADAIERWSSSAVKAHISNLVSNYNLRRTQMKSGTRNIDPRFMLVHTMAHALIKELTFTCGYGSASLRERLYCNLMPDSQPMAGLLIYTASGDAEGTLGGLVNEARPGRLERLFVDALRRSAWCSNDPVCIEAPGKGADGYNLAACHGCVLLPETSCEEGNRLLDRTLLVGSLDGLVTGFFPASVYR